MPRSPQEICPAVSGNEYRQVLYAAGGTQPFRWSVVEGRDRLRAAGLDVSSEGLLHGVACVGSIGTGNIVFTVQVEDSSAQVAQQKLALSVTGVQIGSCNAPPIERLCGDVNGDGARDLSDAVAILTFLFLGNSPDLLGESAEAVSDCMASH